MPTTADIISSIAKELRIITHLASRLQPQHLDYRFTPTQRSTQELLEYLAIIAETNVSQLINGRSDLGQRRQAEVKSIALAALPGVLKAQQQAVENLLAAFTEAEFAAKRIKNYQGNELPLAEALFEGLVKQLVGYKTQLFLQAKAAGVANLGSPDLWRGEAAVAKAG